MIAYAVWGMLGPQPELDFAPSNGTYANACCQKITLADGKLLVGGEWSANYVVRSGKSGPFVEATARVRVDKDGLDVNRYENASLLGLIWTGDRKGPAEGLQVLGNDSKFYFFKREGR